MKKTILLITTLLFSLTIKAATITLADPTIFYEDGVYYLTGTGDVNNGFRMYYSTDLVHWEPCGYATGGRALYKDDTFGTGNFWAPQIFKYGRYYYMAYAANELIGVARATDPAGPYKQTTIKELPHSTGQIDPFIFVDDDDKKYIYYVRFTGGNMLYVAEMTDDFMSIKENTITYCLEAADNTWEHTRSYSNTKITEGPTVIKDGGYYYLIYSANDFHDIDYSVGYAYSRSPKGPWTKVGRPFISRHNTGINGSGHGDLFQGEDGQWYYVFHTHASNTSVDARRTALIPITLTDDPQNKFIPDPGRMFFLTDNANDGATLPEAPVTFVQEGIRYEVMSKKYVQVTYHDPVLFGGYEGDITIPETVTRDGVNYTVYAIGPNAFYNCPRLKNVSLPSGLKKLDTSAFEKCAITSINIPSSTTSIGFRAFADENYLLSVTANRGTPSNILDGTFSSKTLTRGKLWVPVGSHDAYAAARVWKEFHNILEIEDAGIEDVTEVPVIAPTVYNLSGQQVNDNYRGIVISNGRKYLLPGR